MENNYTWPSHFTFTVINSKQLGQTCCSLKYMVKMGLVCFLTLTYKSILKELAALLLKLLIYYSTSKPVCLIPVYFINMIHILSHPLQDGYHLITAFVKLHSNSTKFLKKPHFCNSRLAWIFQSCKNLAWITCT